mgnify:CR=1 FL=1
MYYHQPAGLYRVDAMAIDTGPVAAESHLINYFEYVAVGPARGPWFWLLPWPRQGRVRSRAFRRGGTAWAVG